MTYSLTGMFERLEPYDHVDTITMSILDFNPFLPNSVVTKNVIGNTIPAYRLTGVPEIDDESFIEVISDSITLGHLDMDVNVIVNDVVKVLTGSEPILPPSDRFTSFIHFIVRMLLSYIPDSIMYSNKNYPLVNNGRELGTILGRKDNTVLILKDIEVKNKETYININVYKERIG